MDRKGKGVGHAKVCWESKSRGENSESSDVRIVSKKEKKRCLTKPPTEPDMLLHTSNPSTLEAEAGGSGVHG